MKESVWLVDLALSFPVQSLGLKWVRVGGGASSHPWGHTQACERCPSAGGKALNPKITEMYCCKETECEEKGSHIRARASLELEIPQGDFCVGRRWGGAGGYQGEPVHADGGAGGH